MSILGHAQAGGTHHPSGFVTVDPSGAVELVEMLRELVASDAGGSDKVPNGDRVLLNQQ